MSTLVAVRTRSGEAGFSLLEVIVSMAIMLLVLTGTLSIMSSTMKAQRTAKDVLDMNSHLRASMDLIQRDLLQAGQGLPTVRRITVPNGATATLIVRPGPKAAVAGACGGVSTFPNEGSIPAVTVGAGRGPAISGRCTDIITILAADNMFPPAPLASIISGGTSLVIHNSLNISDNPDVDGDNLHAGDLLMLQKGSVSALMQVTAVSGQTVTFGTGTTADPLKLNQFDGATSGRFGTINRFKATPIADPNTPKVVNGVQQRSPSNALASRIRMITYYVDTYTDPSTARLMRIVGGGKPSVVGLGVQAFQVTYDIADGVNNPTNVRMDATDLTDAENEGACDNGTGADPCSPNQIRKVNVVLSMKALDLRAAEFQGNHTQNTLFTQVSLRSMAFVDRYR